MMDKIALYKSIQFRTSTFNQALVTYINNKVQVLTFSGRAINYQTVLKYANTALNLKGNIRNNQPNHTRTVQNQPICLCFPCTVQKK